MLYIFQHIYSSQQTFETGTINLITYRWRNMGPESYEPPRGSLSQQVEEAGNKPDRLRLELTAKPQCYGISCILNKNRYAYFTSLFEFASLVVLICNNRSRF